LERKNIENDDKKQDAANAAVIIKFTEDIAADKFPTLSSKNIYKTDKDINSSAGDCQT
jgi:hypothetical protein